MPEWQIDDTIKALRTYDSPLIANAIETFKVRPSCDGYLGYEIRCLFPDLPPMVGYAVTLAIDNRTEGRPVRRDAQRQYLEMIRDSPKPVVLVIRALGLPTTHSLVHGGNMAREARALGAIGVVTDGGVRDLAEIRALGDFHLFAPGTVAAHGQSAFGGIRDVGLPVTISGATVRSGDIIHADESGVVVVPPEIAGRIPVEADARRQREQARAAIVNEPHFTLEKLLKARGLI